MRNGIKVTEKDGTTGFLQMEPATTQQINSWNIYKANVKGLKEGTTRISMEGTINFFMYDDTVIAKAPEVTVTVNVTKKNVPLLKIPIAILLSALKRKELSFRLKSYLRIVPRQMCGRVETILLHR